MDFSCLRGRSVDAAKLGEKAPAETSAAASASHRAWAAGQDRAPPVARRIRAHGTRAARRLCPTASSRGLGGLPIPAHPVAGMPSTRRRRRQRHFSRRSWRNASIASGVIRGTWGCATVRRFVVMVLAPSQRRYRGAPAVLTGSKIEPQGAAMFGRRRPRASISALRARVRLGAEAALDHRAVLRDPSGQLFGPV